MTSVPGFDFPAEASTSSRSGTRSLGTPKKFGGFWAIGVVDLLRFRLLNLIRGLCNFPGPQLSLIAVAVLS